MWCLRKTCQEKELAYTLNQIGSLGENRSFPGMWILGFLNDNIKQLCSTTLHSNLDRCIPESSGVWQALTHKIEIRHFVPLGRNYRLDLQQGKLTLCIRKLLGNCICIGVVKMRIGCGLKCICSSGLCPDLRFACSKNRSQWKLCVPARCSVPALVCFSYFSVVSLPPADFLCIL